MHISTFGLFSLTFYILVYMLQTLILFIIILINKHKTTNLFDIKINDLQFLNVENRYLSYIFAINLFSMAGLPPLIGFFSKFYIFNILILNNSIYTLILLIIMSCVSAFYYVRIVKDLFFKKTKSSKFYSETSYIVSILLIIGLLITIGFINFIGNLDLIFNEILTNFFGTSNVQIKPNIYFNFLTHDH